MKLEDENNPYQGLLGLDKLSPNVKTLIWIICFVFSLGPAASGFLRIRESMGSLFYLSWLAIMSPICISAAVLRLAGVKWRYALLLFFLVPVSVMGYYLAINLYYAVLMSA
jgi:hypothetical protein